MKHFATILMLLAISSTSYAEYIPKIYKSINAEIDGTIIISQYGEKDNYLISLQGFEHRNDGETLLYRKKWHNSNLNKGYSYELVGTNTVILRNDGRQTLILGTLVPYSEVYLDRNISTKVVFSENGSQRLHDELVSKYRETQGILESKVKVKSLIKKANDNFASLCSQTLNIDIEWNKFSAINQKTTPGMLKGYLSAMTKICTKDDDYREALKNISTLKVTPSSHKGKDSISIKGNTMFIAIDKDTPNVSETSYQTLLKIL